MIKSTNGIFKPALDMAKKFDQSGNTISKAEAAKIVTTMKKALSAEYDGATSSRGLATDRNVLARTAKAIVKNSDHGKWALTDAARNELTSAFGPKLDGKAGTIGKLVEHIRDTAKASTSVTYYG